jgi:hypothetical protein
MMDDPSNPVDSSWATALVGDSSSVRAAPAQRKLVEAGSTWSA